MRKILIVLVTVIAIAAFDPAAYANGPIKKLGRGIANVATSPLELIKGMGDAKEEKGIFAAMTWGVVQGTVNIVKRATVGVYEVATFPVPLPKDYAPIIEDPEYFLEKEKIE